MKVFLSTILYVVFLSCTKTTKPCNSIQSERIGFDICEKIADTLLPTDTAYENYSIFFKSNENYRNIKWKIGEDTRSFSEPLVNIIFSNPEDINVKLSAYQANPCDAGKDTTVSKSFTILKDDGTIISPIVGKYIGYEKGNESKLFVIELKYWFGSRYPWWQKGAYSIHNLPNGFKDSTQNFNGAFRPEIDGIVVSNGYKNFSFNKSGFIPALGIKGAGSLKRGAMDSLIINYSVIDTAIYKQSGTISYLLKKFIGIRQ